MISNSHIDGLVASGLFAPLTAPAPLSLLFFSLLSDAEARYGPRDRSWTFGGINYRADGGPATMPSTDGNKSVVICLTQDALSDQVLQRWQLAHEVVHLLCPPNVREEATVFEEGLASYNQFIHSSGGYTGQNLFPRSPHDYQTAFDLVRPLVELHPSGVRDMRAECNSLSPLGPALISKHFPSVAEDLALELSRCFY